MAIFTIGTPDGRKIKIEAPDEATAVRGAQEYVAANPAPQKLTGSVAPQQATPTEGSANIEMQAQPQRPVDLGTATAATISGFVNGIPLLGPLAQGASDNLMGLGSQLMGGDYGQTVEGLKSRREELAQAAPIASLAGEIGGNVASLGGLAKTVGQEALGLGGKFLPGMAKSAASGQAIYTADQHARGNTGLDTLGNGLPALAGAGGRVLGDVVSKVGGGVADAVTAGSQRRLTSAAVKGGTQGSGELKSAASQMFEQATGGNPVMLSDTAYFRFLGGVKQVADKFRINADNDKQSVGLLETLMRIADDTANGVRVDMKDLHLVRQLAQKVAQSSEGRDQAFGGAVVRQMDDFIRSMKPADILGGADPSQAANQLLTGISTWARANKVATIEEAIRTGQLAASGPEKGVRNALRKLMTDADQWRQFSAPEKRAIEDVVNGTAGSNALKLLGTFGFGGNTATNGVGGALGMFLGNTIAPGVGMVAAPIIGAVAKKGSEAMTNNLARRALAAAGTPNIPAARQAPNLLGGAKVPLHLLLRGGAFAGSN